MHGTVAHAVGDVQDGLLLFEQRGSLHLLLLLQQQRRGGLGGLALVGEGRVSRHGASGSQGGRPMHLHAGAHADAASTRSTAHQRSRVRWRR